MREKLEIFLFDRLLCRSITSDNEKHLFLISYAASAYAIVIHLFLLLFHLFSGVSFLLFLSLCALLIDILLFILVRKRRYVLFGILLSGLVLVYALASAVCIGTDNFVMGYLFVTLMMQITVPYASVRVRALVVVALWGGMSALAFINHHMVPIWDIGAANAVLAFFNIQLAFFCTVIQLTFGNIILDVIARANRRELEENKTFANTDPLTGLLNRRYAATLFKRLSAGQLEQLWCIAMLDVDNFKEVNDVHGHQAGDAIIKSIGDFIKTSLRSRDFVFRWGGEEFLILLKDVDIATTYRILDKLRGKIEMNSIETQGKSLKVTVTIGACALDIDNVERSISTCDRLMYKGKTMGKNVVVV